MKKLIRLAGIIAGIGAAIWLMKDRFLQIPEAGEGEISAFRVPSSDGERAPQPEAAPTPARVVETAPPAAEAAAPAVETATPPSDDLTEINGIGPVYAGRLAESGYTTFAELAVANAAQVADLVNVTPEQVEDWITQATERA